MISSGERPMGAKNLVVLARQIQRIAQTAFINFSRSVCPTDVTQQSWAANSASARLLELSGKKISIPERLDVTKVLALAAGDSKKTHALMRGCPLGNMATFLHREGLVRFSHETVNETLRDSLKRREKITFTHSSSNDNIRQILEDRKLKEPFVMRGGVASQTGICASTDLESKSMRGAILKTLGTDMMFFGANCDQVTLGSSAYAYSDRTTVKASGEWDISPIFMYLNNQLVILDHLAFSQMQIGGLMINFFREHFEAIQLAAMIITLSEDSLYDCTGKSYALEDFQYLTLPEKVDILRNTILVLAETHDIHKLQYFKTAFFEYGEQVDTYEKSLRNCLELCEKDPSLKEAVSQFAGLMESLSSTLSRSVGLESKPGHP